MSKLETLNNHIDLCTQRLELEDQALLATAAGDYDQADQCDWEIEQLTGQIEELSKTLDEEAAPNSGESSKASRPKVFCPDCDAEMQIRIHKHMVEPYESYLYFYCPGRCQVVAGLIKGFDPEKVPSGTPKFYVPLEHDDDIDQIIARVAATNLKEYFQKPGINQADKSQDEIQKLRRALLDKTEIIGRAALELNKAITVFDHWMNEYLYCEKPDPRAAISWGSGRASGQHYEQSAQWYFEYESITQFISIASDYVYNSKELLDGALKEA